MWTKLISYISELAFWFVTLLAVTLSVVTVLTVTGNVASIPLWVAPLATLGMVWCFCAGTIPIIALAIGKIISWMYNTFTTKPTE